MGTPAESSTYDDFIRPGEQGFTSFPKILLEDTVHYTIHVLGSSLATKSALRSRLNEIRNAATGLTNSLLSDYIWQHESFNLAIAPSLEGRTDATSSDDEMLHLQGTTSFGDSIADEWLIVFLLRELSKKFNDAWIRVWDADGEFLLVEAANALPAWLNPEVAEYRIWINQGELKIIPRYNSTSTSRTSASSTSKSTSKSAKPTPQTPRIITLPYALNYLQTNQPSALLHDPAIQTEAFHRLRNYPFAIASTMHTALVTIPRTLASILHRCPSHISPAITAFYLRDPIALAPLRRPDNTSLKFPPDDLVTVPVKFTRVGFAQLRGQDFATPNKAWSDAILDSADALDTRQRKEMGMKLACGFEMMLGEAADVDARAVREVGMLLEDLESGDEVLPSNEEVAAWVAERKVDGEEWLDVDFAEFEKELAGRGGGGGGEENMGAGFGDKDAQANLRRMVERFEQLLKDDVDGVDADGFEDEMDYDDDDDDDDDDYHDDEDDEEELVSHEDGHEDAMLQQPFDDEQFKAMMKQLGLPLEQEDIRNTGSRIWEVGSDDDDENEPVDPEEMKKIMERMEAELRDLGAFDRP